MPKWATGKRSQSISDRSGMAFPYNEMVKEWNGSLVHYSEFEPKHPQIRRKFNVSDAIALQNSRNQKFQQPTQEFTNDQTTSDSGGITVGVANLSLPGDFAFKTQDFEITRNGVTSILHSMIPEDPSLQNGRRQLNLQINNVTVNTDPGVGFAITVANPGSGNKFYVDGAQQSTLNFVKGNTYTFNQGDSSNAGHALLISTTSDGTHSGGVSYNTGVTVNGIPGNSGAYTSITVDSSAPSVLYYYCSVHSGMGGQINIT